MITAPPMPQPATAGAFVDEDRSLRRMIWVYFWLLILEGALRKWVVPSLANPLLVIRDPVAILIYFLAISRNRLPLNGFVTTILGLGVASVAVSLLAGRGTFLITIFGWRTNFLHLPLIFVIPQVFTLQDVKQMGKWVMLLAFPMALLVAAQFRASPESFLNVGVGGSTGGQMEVGFGRIRPPGTFSFNTGLMAYIGLLAAYIFSTLMRAETRERKLAMAALPALGLMVGVSASRSSLSLVAIILAGAVFVGLVRRELFARGIKGLVFIAVVYLALSSWSQFQEGMKVHEYRFSASGGLKVGIAMRIVEGLAAPFYAVADTPFFGVGLGMGTNFAGGLLTGERNFLLAEGEWERVVRESGPILGFAYIALRLGILAYLLRHSLAALWRGEPLPLLIFCASAPALLNGQFGVPTTLGFAVFGAGLTLAAAQKETAPAEDNAADWVVEVSPQRLKTVRGRSIFSEQLHGE